MSMSSISILSILFWNDFLFYQIHQTQWAVERCLAVWWQAWDTHSSSVSLTRNFKVLSLGRGWGWWDWWDWWDSLLLLNDVLLDETWLINIRTRLEKINSLPGTPYKMALWYFPRHEFLNVSQFRDRDKIKVNWEGDNIDKELSWNDDWVIWMSGLVYTE